MYSDGAEETYILGRMRSSLEMAERASDQRAALAHEQMNYCYLARLAELRQFASAARLEDGRFPVRLDPVLKPEFHAAGRGLVLVAN
jgi:hypothetical protein